MTCSLELEVSYRLAGEHCNHTSEVLEILMSSHVCAQFATLKVYTLSEDTWLTTDQFVLISIRLYFEVVNPILNVLSNIPQILYVLNSWSLEVSL